MRAKPDRLRKRRSLARLDCRYNERVNESQRSTHAAFLGAWVLIALLVMFGWGYLGGRWLVYSTPGAALCLVPILGHALVLRGKSAGGGIVALACVVALVPALVALPFGFLYFVGVYPFVGLAWIAFLLANVVYGSKALKD